MPEKSKPSPPTPALFSSPEKRNLVLSLLLVVATLALYNPVNRHPFVNYDDDRYVIDNPHIHNGLGWDTITWAFTSTEQANWHPLTWLSHALDYSLFHQNPAGHHFTSLLLHAANAVLLFWLLASATGRVGPSLFVASLFALHPINVESVAWVAERKNVLSTFFFLAAIGAYGWYAQKPHWQRYLAVAGLFALGLMAKPMVITFPFVLLLLDYWPLGRIAENPTAALRTAQSSPARLLAEKLPLLALSAASAVITMQAQQAGGAVRSTAQFSLAVRLENAVVAYAMYLWKMIWPSHLAPIYPHPGESLAAWQIAISLLTLLAITGVVLKIRSKRYLLSGWLWFLGTLVPVIGLVQVGDQAMADRYAYIPLIGIFVMLVWSAADLADFRRLGIAAQAIPAACVLLALSFATHRQLAYWGNNYDLWTHALAVTENNFIAEDNLGGALLLLGKPDEAYLHFQTAAKINSRDPMSRSNLGAYFQEHGRLNEAIEQEKRVIDLTSDPGLLAATYANLGTAYRRLGQDEKARESYDQALRLNSSQANAYLGLGELLEKENKLDQAIANYSKSVELRPTDSGFLLLGHALESAGRRAEALSAYQQALKISPDLPEAQHAVDALGATPH
ncbi:MAG TPA: tetratricopeptide repeat protein [Terriglobales bacterium]|nr:tetratricopeptide repeat protein [Terriglobales bacterium]